MYWFHDLDTFQNETITVHELELGSADMGLTDKGRVPRWSTASVFFRDSSKDIFGWIKKITYIIKANEEYALTALTRNNIPWTTIPGAEKVNERVKKINISFGFLGWNIRSTYQMAIKPIKAVHFHPFGQAIYPGGVTAIDFFMHGKNQLNMVLMPERLIKIFNQHGIK